MTKLEQVATQSTKIIEISKEIQAAHKDIESASKRLLIAQTELLAYTKEINKPIIQIVKEEK